MSKNQTRRSISISMETYDSLKEYTTKYDFSMSGVVETLIRDYLGLSENTKIDSFLRKQVLREGSIKPTKEMPEPLFGDVGYNVSAG